MSNHEYTQGVCHDGAAILKDGSPMTIEEILAELRAGQDTSGPAPAYQCIWPSGAKYTTGGLENAQTYRQKAIEVFGEEAAPVIVPLVYQGGRVVADGWADLVRCVAAIKRSHNLKDADCLSVAVWKQDAGYQQFYSQFDFSVGDFVDPASSEAVDTILLKSFLDKAQRADEARSLTNNQDERNYWLGVRMAYRDAAGEFEQASLSPEEKEKADAEAEEARNTFGGCA